MSKVLTVRVDDGLAKWAEGYAASRGATRQQIHVAALREFRELCARGVPDLPEVKSGGRPKVDEPPANLAGQRAVTQERYEARMRERDRILAEARASVGRRGS